MPPHESREGCRCTPVRAAMRKSTGGYETFENHSLLRAAKIALIYLISKYLGYYPP